MRIDPAVGTLPRPSDEAPGGEEAPGGDEAKVAEAHGATTGDGGTAATTVEKAPGIRERESRTVGRPEMVAYIHRVAAILERHVARLDRLDAALGDGDHGENMVTGWRAVLAALEDDTDEEPGDLLRRIGHVLVASVGGASGPLYGTAFIEAGFVLKGRVTLDLGALADACDAATRALARRGRCSIGDKTILDALAPASEALRAGADANAEIGDALAAAAAASARGMRSTIPLVARRGLALRLGERSRGHQDPGATSCFLLFRAVLPGRTAAGSIGRAGPKAPRADR